MLTAAASRRLRPAGFAAALLLLLAAGIGGLAFGRGGPSDPADGWTLRRGQPAPAVDLPGLADPTARVTLFEDGSQRVPVVMNVFSSTCAPCVKELPAVEAAARQHRESVRVIGVDFLDRRSAGLALVRRTGVTFPVGFDETGALAMSYRLRGLPSTFFVHADGTLANFVLGPLDATDLARNIARLRAA